MTKRITFKKPIITFAFYETELQNYKILPLHRFNNKFFYLAEHHGSSSQTE